MHVAGPARERSPSLGSRRPGMSDEISRRFLSIRGGPRPRHRTTHSIQGRVCLRCPSQQSTCSDRPRRRRPPWMSRWRSLTRAAHGHPCAIFKPEGPKIEASRISHREVTPALSEPACAFLQTPLRKNVAQKHFVTKLATTHPVKMIRVP